MVQFIRRGAYLALALIFFNSSAQAATIVVTYTGLVAAGSENNTGRFGLTGTSIVGSSFVAEFKVDLDKAGASVTSTPFASGVSGNNSQNPVIFSKLTINGDTYVLGNFSNQLGNNGRLKRPPGLTIDAIASLSQSGEEVYGDPASPSSATYAYSERLQVTKGSRTDFLTLDLSQPFYYVGLGEDFSGGNFEYFEYDYEKFAFVNLSIIQFETNSVEVVLAAASAVPEETTWLMFIFGFGLAGAGLRSTRSMSARLPLHTNLKCP